MRRARSDATRTDVVLPGSAVAFCALMLFLAPSYPRWFGAALPPFTARFLALYPLWLAFTSVALAVAAVGEGLPPLARRPRLRRALDALLAVASIAIVAAGIIALALPLLVPAEAQ